MKEKTDLEINYEKNLAELIAKDNEKCKKFDFGALLPMLSCIGIIAYFRFGITVPLSLTITSGVIFMIMRFFDFQYRIIPGIIFFLLFGFSASEIRMKSISQTNIVRKAENVKLISDVKEIKTGEEVYKITVKINEDNHKKKLHGKLRCNVDKNFVPKNLKPGDKIFLSADIFALPKPVYPKAYNFSDVAKFDGIIGMCKPNEKIKILEKNYSIFSSFFEKIRLYINKTLALKSSENDEIGISMALITGNKEYISQETLNYVKRAGLSHLLAISGLHMTIIAMASFSAIQRFIAKSEYLLLNYHIKKLSAIFALCVSFFYLQISGMPLSANRSFIMFSVGMFAILKNRNPFNLRTLNVAIFLIIAFKPESIFNPSFQMSFMAVLALISSAKKFYVIWSKNAPKIIKFGLYAWQIALTSLIATVGTSVYSIYHFNQFSIAGIFTNVIAVPITEFLIMPLIIFGLFLSPISTVLGSVFIKFGQIFAGFVAWIAKFSGSMKYSCVLISQMPELSLLLHTICLLILFIIKGKWKYVSIIFFTSGILIHIFSAKPKVILTRDDNFIFKYNGKYSSLNEIENGFMNLTYSSKLGQGGIKKADDKTISEIFDIKKRFIIYKNNDIKIIVPRGTILENDCKIINCNNSKKCFVLNRSKIKQICKNIPEEIKFIKKWDIIKTGVFIVR